MTAIQTPEERALTVMTALNKAMTEKNPGDLKNALKELFLDPSNTTQETISTERANEKELARDTADAALKAEEHRRHPDA